MTELFKLVGRIVVEGADKAKKDISGVSGEGEKSQGLLSKAFSGIGKGAVAVGKAMTVGLTAGAGAISLITGAATSAYASYEQLVGGVDTLFGDSSAKVQEYADNAYKTAGLSANAYMEQVTSFSASLLQSLGGDTSAAADYADVAIRDMSDNANKMGTDMQRIQDAYQGFAKQNYTMLDNLKLGYGGTKGEMERLIEDANRVKVANGEMADLSIDSFADVTEAIHIIQTEMGITGTTAAEAEGTITGSAASVSAAWQNLLVGLGDDNADLGLLIDQFVESAVTSFGNLIPRIGTILGGISDLILGLIPQINAMLPELIATLLPPLIQGAATLLIGLAAALPELIQVIIAMIPTLLSTIGQAVAAAFPNFFNTLTIFFQNIVNGFMGMCEWTEKNQNLIILLGIAVGTLTAAILAYNSAALIKKALDIAETVQIAALIAADYAHAVASGVATAATTAFGAAIAFLTSPITLVILAIGAFIAAGVLLWKNWDTVKAKASELWSAVTSKFESMKNSVISKFEAIKSGIKEKFDAAAEFVRGAIDKMKGFFNFKWELPKIKLPHFSISGKFSLNPPSIPHFSVDWYKKAMDNPMLLTDPTIFGYNASTGQLMGGGEAGAEVVSGAATLMNMIGNAVSSNNEVLVAVLYKILEAILALDANMGGNLAEAMAGMGWKVNDREFARLVRKAVT